MFKPVGLATVLFPQEETAYIIHMPEILSAVVNNIFLNFLKVISYSQL